jgi:hypothetical protein
MFILGLFSPMWMRQPEQSARGAGQSGQPGTSTPGGSSEFETTYTGGSTKNSAPDNTVFKCEV